MELYDLTMWCKPAEASALRRLVTCNLFDEVALSEFTKNGATRHHRSRIRKLFRTGEFIGLTVENPQNH